MARVGENPRSALLPALDSILKSKGSPTVRHWEWSEGLHSVGTNTLYVNRGLGTYAPGRLFCPPEVTIFTLIKPYLSEVTPQQQR